LAASSISTRSVSSSSSWCGDSLLRISACDTSVTNAGQPAARPRH
jgi:hypothetical protein